MKGFRRQSAGTLQVSRSISNCLARHWTSEILEPFLICREKQLVKESSSLPQEIPGGHQIDIILISYVIALHRISPVFACRRPYEREAFHLNCDRWSSQGKTFYTKHLEVKIPELANKKPTKHWTICRLICQTYSRAFLPWGNYLRSVKKQYLKPNLKTETYFRQSKPKISLHIGFGLSHFLQYSGVHLPVLLPGQPTVYQQWTHKTCIKLEI